MSFPTSTILVGGTPAVPATGGTATAFFDRGNSNNNQRILVLDEGKQYQDEITFSLEVKEPKVNAGSPGGYTQGRTSCRINSPVTLVNGNRTVNTVTVNVSVDPETSRPDVKQLLILAAQSLCQSDFVDFHSFRTLTP